MRGFGRWTNLGQDAYTATFPSAEDFTVAPSVVTDTAQTDLEAEISRLKLLLTDLERTLKEERARADTLQTGYDTLSQRLAAAKQQVFNFNEMIKSWLM